MLIGPGDLARRRFLIESDVNGGVVRELSLFSADSGGYIGPYQLLR